MSSVRDSRRPHDLYRFYDADDRLLYVGISLNAAQRASQHKAEKSWWSDVRRMEVKPLGVVTRFEAERIERAAIENERPLHNITHNANRNRTTGTALIWVCEICDAVIEDDDGYIELPRSERRRHSDAMQEWESLRPEVDPDATAFERLKASLITPEQLLSMPPKAHWWAIHRSCDPDVNSGSYWIDVGKVRTQADVLRWTAHLMSKRWLIDTDWRQLIECVASDVSSDGGIRVKTQRRTEDT